jgi:hypothetical protein
MTNDSIELKTRFIKYRGAEKSLTRSPSGHKQRLFGSETVIIGVLLDFDVDQQILRNARAKNPALRGRLNVGHSKSDIAQMPIRLYYRFKRHHER